jgi:hypothetical protein
MRLIANGTQGGTSVPTPQALTGTPGYANSGTPGAFTETVLDPDEFNVLLAEGVALATFGGAALGAGNNQWLTAMLLAAAANVTAISGSGALTAAEAGLLFVNAAGGNVALTLPLAASAGGAPIRYTIVRTDTSGNTVSVALSGADTPLLFASPLAVLTGTPVMLAADGVSRWAMTSGAPRWRQVFTSSGTLTIPSYTRLINATVVAGGSGATGCSASVFAGACGAGGGWAVGRFTVTPDGTLAVTVGAGGAGSAAGVASSAGGASSLGSLLSATGGGAAGTSSNAGGIGGVGTGGDYQGNGGDGSDGMTAATVANWPGVSGASLLGGSRRCGSDAGFVGGAPGAGGSAPYSQPSTTTNGSAGAGGIVIVEGL